MEKECQTNRKAQINTSFCQLFFPEESDKILYSDKKNKWKQGKKKKEAQIWENFKTSPKNIGYHMQEKADGSVE